MNNVRVTRPYRKRRQYTPEFKAQLVAESQNPEASVARIALDNDFNANLLRRWFTESKQADQQYRQLLYRLICQRQLLHH